MTRELRCPMRECRRRIDLDALPQRAFPERDACMHFVAAWGGRRGPMVEETLTGLEGNREFVIRNIRPADVPLQPIEALRGDLEAAIERFGHVVSAPSEDRDADAGGALFGDEFERNGVARALARLLAGPDPIATGAPRPGGPAGRDA